MSAKDQFKRVLQRWVRFWERLQGAELEPHVWHSHFLSAQSLDAGIRAMCQRLSGRVLDVGAGTGFGRRYLDTERTLYIPTDLRTGRDPSDSAVTRQGENLKIVCSGYALPFRETSFDAVMAHSLLEHVTNPETILSEAHRVLRHNGTLVVSVPFCFPVHGFPNDFRRWTCEGLKLEVERAGFEVCAAIAMGNAFYSLALNFNLLLRYGLPASSRVLHVLVSACWPFLLLAQMITNLLALVLGPLDRSGKLPVMIGLEAKKGRLPLVAAERP